MSWPARFIAQRRSHSSAWRNFSLAGGFGCGKMKFLTLKKAITSWNISHTAPRNIRKYAPSIAGSPIVDDAITAADVRVSQLAI